MSPVTLSDDENSVELFFTFKLQCLKFLSYGKHKGMPVHAINMGSGGLAPLTVNLCNIWWWLVRCIHQLLYVTDTSPLLLLEYEGFDDARIGFYALH